MKIILLQDLKTIGKKGEIKDVSDGYARNFLIPKKYAAIADSNNLNEIKQKKASEEHRAKILLEEAKNTANKLSDSVIEVKLKTGGGTKLFGALTSKEIAEGIQKQTGIEIDKKKLVIPEQIKSLGDYEVSLKLHKDVSVKIKIRVAAL